MSEPGLVEQLRELSAKATQGTWSWEDSPPTVYAGRVDPVGEFGGMPICGHGCNLFGRMTDISRNGRADLDFAVACVNFVRSNLDALERLSRSDVAEDEVERVERALYEQGIVEREIAPAVARAAIAAMRSV